MDRLLAIDIGGGTQDILLYETGKPLENCVQLVLPSPTVIVAGKINRATEQGKPVWLHGRVMGGGPSAKAVKNHLACGLPVFATREAALTMHDNPEIVRQTGIVITEDPPAKAMHVRLGDLDTHMLERILGEVGVTLPEQYAVAVQDHGYSPDESNRIFRFRIWEQFMAAGGRLKDLAYKNPPEYLTRMRAVQDEFPDTLLMDTCGAALLGALTDPLVSETAERAPVAIINLGNQHTFAAIVQKDRILGLFEHHTGVMSAEKVNRYLKKLCSAELTNKEIQDDLGHGSVPPASPLEPSLTVATGPRRAMLSPDEYYFAAPQGNMMLMGCFGLVAAAGFFT
ncbi:MAG: DUF1786 domain-containing protein [Bacillota bacterium]|nr:DUF1786 domain-containing protein [Bacillota bacterium]MDW7683927.1 DUF1786 domain-containing protein [Bacillota bacterium]